MQTDAMIHLVELALGIKIYFKKKLHKMCELSWHSHLLWSMDATASLQRAESREWVPASPSESVQVQGPGHWAGGGVRSARPGSGRMS